MLPDFLHRGVTLIELLIVVGIIAVTSGMSMVGYNRFQENQSVRVAAAQLSTDLRQTQQKALSGEKPSGWCTSGTLASWRLIFISTTQYDLRSVCSDATTRTDKTVSLPNNTSCSDAGCNTQAIDFLVLTGAADAAETFTVQRVFPGRTVSNSVQVNQAGAVLLTTASTPIPTPTPTPGIIATITPTLTPGAMATVTPTPTNTPVPGGPTATRTPTPAPSTNLLPNPSFEQGSAPSSITGYFFWPKTVDVPSVSYSWATDQVRTGTHAAKITSTTTDPSLLSRWLSNNESIAATPGTTYRSTVWVRTQSIPGQAYLILNFWDSGFNWINGGNSTTVTGTTPGWVELTATATAPSNAATLRFEMRLVGPGTVWWEDGSIVTTP